MHENAVFLPLDATEAFCYASWRFKSYYANGGFPRLNYVAM